MEAKNPLSFDVLSEDELCLSRDLWTGFIAIELLMDSRDIASPDLPKSVYAQGNRMGYLPQIAQSAIQYFRSFAVEAEDDKQNEYWFTFLDRPILAHLPLGVWFDSLSLSTSPLCPSLPLPLQLTVHFSSFPAVHLLRCGHVPLMRSLYCHSLKQALFLLQGSTRGFNELSPEQQEQLWMGACEGNRDVYEAVAKLLRPCTDDSALVDTGTVTTSCTTRNPRLPFRVVVSSSSSASDSATYTLQAPFSLESSSGIGTDMDKHQPRATDATTTLRTALLYALSKDHHHGQRHRLLIRHLTEPLAGTVGVATTKDNGMKTGGEMQVQVLVQGISLPLHAPLARVWRLFHSADMYLYVSVRTVDDEK